jgi:carbonic anhydrase
MKNLALAAFFFLSPAFASDHGHAPEAHAPAHPEKAEEHHAPTSPAKKDEHGAKAAHPAPQEAPKAKSPTHWSYAGHEGPENWGKLDPEFAACIEGKEQSPIDLKWSKQKGKRKISFHYAEGPLHVVDNGHTIQVNVPVGSYAMIDGQRFSLVQFHFHAESEHTFSGRHFPLELHFVHKNAEGKLAAVGVMFEVGAKNNGLETVFLNMPGKAHDEKRVMTKFNPASLLPSVHTHYQYSGSLTTPPCSEGVNWTVLNTPMPISEEQLAQFHRAYVHNNRPLQELHERHPASF